MRQNDSRTRSRLTPRPDLNLAMAKLGPVFCLRPRHVDRPKRLHREGLECWQRRFPGGAAVEQLP